MTRACNLTPNRRTKKKWPFSVRNGVCETTALTAVGHSKEVQVSQLWYVDNANRLKPEQKMT
jgi:hypothetical protein